MPDVFYRRTDGTSDRVQADEGADIMRTAIIRGVRGIIGECGGEAMCATCHVYVHDQWVDRLPPIGDEEEEMLTFTLEPRDARRSRLGCQVRITDDLDGITVDLPERQA
jgi:2Fe-2S ferredoxin